MGKARVVTRARRLGAWVACKVHLCVHTPYYIISIRGTKGGGWSIDNKRPAATPTNDLAPSPDFAMCYPLIIALNVAGTF